MTTNLIPTRLSRGLQRWFDRDPFDGFRQEMNELIKDFESEWNGELTAQTVMPRADISETDGSFQVTMDVPGLKSDEIDIEVRGNRLEVRGEHKEEKKEDKEEKGRTWHRVERRRGTLYRSMMLPAEVNEDKVAAECKNGVLTITLPKTEKSKAKKVAVNG